MIVRWGKHHQVKVVWPLQKASSHREHSYFPVQLGSTSYHAELNLFAAVKVGVMNLGRVAWFILGCTIVPILLTLYKCGSGQLLFLGVSCEQTTLTKPSNGLLFIQNFIQMHTFFILVFVVKVELPAKNAGIIFQESINYPNCLIAIVWIKSKKWQLFSARQNILAQRNILLKINDLCATFVSQPWILYNGNVVT